MRDYAIERAAVKGDRFAVLKRPAKPSGGQAERGRRGKASHLLGGDMRGERRSDAVEEGVAGRQNARRGAASRFDDVDASFERGRPRRRCSGKRLEQSQMAGAA